MLRVVLTYSRRELGACGLLGSTMTLSASASQEGHLGARHRPGREGVGVGGVMNPRVDVRGGVEKAVFRRVFFDFFSTSGME
jgi:hypothetical protein